MKIKVKNIEAFSTFLKGIGKVSSHFHFQFTEKEMIVRTVNEGKTVRMILKTDAATSDGEPFVVNFMNVGNLIKSIQVVASLENIEYMDITYEEPFIFYEHIARFKLKTVKFDVIEKHVSGDFGTFDPAVCSFETTSDAIGKVIQQMSMFAGQDMFVYLKERGGQVVCDLDNHAVKIGDSIGLPLGTMWRGSPDRLICVKMDSFKLINLFPDSQVFVGITGKGIFITEVNCPIELKNDGMIPTIYNINMRMICSTLKT